MVLTLSQKLRNLMVENNEKSHNLELKIVRDKHYGFQNFCAIMFKRGSTEIFQKGIK